MAKKTKKTSKTVEHQWRLGMQMRDLLLMRAAELRYTSYRRYLEAMIQDELAHKWLAGVSRPPADLSPQRAGEYLIIVTRINRELSVAGRARAKKLGLTMVDYIRRSLYHEAVNQILPPATE